MWAGPLCTRLLAEWGAEVTTIEPAVRPDGFRGSPAQFTVLDVGKRRVDIDLRTPAGRDAFERLVAQSDLVVESFSRRVMPNLGYADLRAINPAVSTVSIRSFPVGSPERDWVAYGRGVHAAAGLGMWNGRPQPVPIAYPDPLTGFTAFAACVAAIGRSDQRRGHARRGDRTAAAWTTRNRRPVHRPPAGRGDEWGDGCASGAVMSWQPEVDELAERRRLIEQMGGEDGVARQHSRGKLTVRERIPLLADPGTFRELGGLRGQGDYDEHGNLTGLVPQGRVEGMCLVDGRKVVVTAGDFTVRGGSGGGDHGGLGQEPSASAARPGVAPPVRPPARRGRRQRAQLRGDRPHLPARRQQLHLSRDPADEHRPGGVGGARRSGRDRRAAHQPGPLERDGRGHPGVPRRAAGGQGRARPRHHQGGARRAAGAHGRQRRRRQLRVDRASRRSR